MKTWTIHSNDGEILYKGRAASPRKFLERLARQRKSFANANLKGMSLAGFNLAGADFTDADLEDADLRGANLKGARMKGVVLKNALMHGANLNDAQLQGAMMMGAKLNGVTGIRTHFRGAILDEADLQQANLPLGIFTYTSIQKANLSDATLTQADFGSALIIKSKFHGADLRSDDTVPLENQADRTRNAVIVSCEYDKETRFTPQVTEAFNRDRLRSKLARGALSTTTSLLALGAFTLVDSLFPGMDLSSMLTQKSPLELGVISVFSIPTLLLLKDKAQDLFKDLLGNSLVDMTQKVRKALNSMKVKRNNLKNLVVACANEISLAPLQRALTATQQNSSSQGTFKQFAYVTSNDLGAFIICDRKHLGEALGAISSNRMRGYSLSKEILLLRYLSPREDESVPAAVRFHKNGETTMVWTEDGEPRHVVLYDNKGLPKARLALETGMGTTEVDDLPNAADIFTATEAFEKKILEEHEMEHFHYPRDTHFVHAGRDGSIIVRRIRDRKLDNPLGPALITSDGQYNARDGQLSEIESEPQAAAEKSGRSFKIHKPIKSIARRAFPGTEESAHQIDLDEPGWAAQPG